MKVRSGTSKKKESKSEEKEDKAEEITLPTPSENMSVSVEKIENGFLVTKSGEGKEGWESKKYFSEKNPLAKV
jgi:hypothetical protein